MATAKVKLLRGYISLITLVIILATPVVTTPAHLARQDVDSYCGIWYDAALSSRKQDLHSHKINVLTSSVATATCSYNIPCAIATYLTPNYVFCSPTGQQPITEVFEYEHGPEGGCGTGQLCW